MPHLICLLRILEHFKISKFQFNNYFYDPLIYLKSLLFHTLYGLSLQVSLVGRSLPIQPTVFSNLWHRPRSAHKTGSL